LAKQEPREAMGEKSAAVLLYSQLPAGRGGEVGAVGAGRKGCRRRLGHRAWGGLGDTEGLATEGQEVQVLCIGHQWRRHLLLLAFPQKLPSGVGPPLSGCQATWSKKQPSQDTCFMSLSLIACSSPLPTLK
jgi:hypothetical protein